MKSLLIMLLGTLLLFSCSKEGSFERDTDDPVVPEGGLLTKTITKEDGSTDSIVTTFFYDSEKRIRKINTLHVSTDDLNIEAEYRYYRNSSGLVERYVEFARFLDNGVPLYEDSVIGIVHNNGTQYTYSIFKGLNLSGDPFSDSAVYAYNNKGQLSDYKLYDIDYDNREFVSHHTTYSYDAKDNISIIRMEFKDDSQSNDPPQIISLQYDDKVSAMNFGSDMLLTGFYSLGLCNPSNETRYEDPSQSSSINMSYEYNNINKPVKSIQTDVSGGRKATMNYYYQ
ncbi:MAG: hypothetical protein KF862_03450 [Chitinophagaceae bacterium]|nr:hypothetical protein [Chitinophagaceae bacterium]